MRRWLFLLLVVPLLITSGRLALADSAPMLSLGPHLQPMASTTVRLAEERIDINLRRNRERPTDFGWTAMAEYRIWFRFVPTADEQLTVGFPLFVIDREQRLDGVRIQEMQVLLDGQAVTTELRKGVFGNGESDWAVFPVAFHKDQPLEMVVTYKMPVVGKMQASDLWVAYVLQTGAFWAGSIGRAEAVLTMDKPIREEDIRIKDSVRTTTPGWSLTAGALHWVWEDVEPDFDLSVALVNAYWLDTAADIRAVLDSGAGDRNTLLQLLGGTLALYAGDGKFGLWMKVRGDLSSQQAGEPLVPDVLKQAQGYLADHPADWAVWEAYLWLLRESAWHVSVEGASLVSEERVALFLRELHRYTAAGGRETWLSNFAPWLDPAMREHQWADETQAAIGAFLSEEMYHSFTTENQAREWIAQHAGGALQGAHAEALLAAALGRVQPPQPAPALDPTPAPVPDPVADPVPVPGGVAIWEIGAGGLLLLASAAVLAYRVRANSKRRASPGGQ